MNNSGLCQGKAAVTRSQPLTSIVNEVKNEWSYTILPPSPHTPSWCVQAQIYFYYQERPVAAKVKAAIPAESEVPLNCFGTYEYRQLLE